MKYRWYLLFMVCQGLAVAQFLPGDTDGDGQVDLADSERVTQFLLGQATIVGNGDCNLDGTVDYLDVICILNARPGDLVTTSPDHLETDVAVTRETVLRFSMPLDPVNLAAAVTVTSAGIPLSLRTHLSSDGTGLTLFYDPALPAAATIDVTINGEVLTTIAGTKLDVDGDGHPGGLATIQFETLALDVVAGTAVTGRVFASEQASNGQPGGLEVGLGGVNITVDGMEETLFTTTDALGNFRLEPAPTGRFFVHIDGGATINHTPAGAYYPRVGKAWEAVAGEEVNVGNVFLPLIRNGTLQAVSPTAMTEITFPQSILDDFPQLAGTKLNVPADALFSDDGSRGGMVGMAPVDPNRLPGALPSTLPLPLVITVQTDGPTNFDQPVPVCFPNLADPITGELAPPGSASALVSFNHDSGRFEVVGSMTVSPDGLMVCSDPGQGILAPGWHGARAGTSGGGGKNRGGRDGDDDDDPNDPDRDDQDDKDREKKEEKGPQDTPPAEPPNSNSDSPDENQCPTEDEDEAEGEEGADPVDPVYLFSGEFYHKETDLRIKGRGFDFIWARKYRSQLALKSAVGNAWDFSYNIRLKRANCGQANPERCALILYDGNTRRDRYHFNEVANCYLRDEFFRQLDENPDDSFTLTFANRGRWDFRPLDGNPGEGKIASITDRNGNIMRFEYDGQGRLAKVIDTLNREIVVGYGGSNDPEALIQTVTDFAGRVIRYTYFDGTTPGGNAGDLASCTSPAVTGTPHGNDFPNGKTIAYTYQKESPSVPRRNWGNLLTMTDGRRNDPNDSTFGQGPWLVNQYDSSDRMVRQEWGGDVVDVYYNNVFPSRANNQAVKQTIVNDRKGHVKEFWWDRRNRCVLKREYTGTANPTERTTFFSNLPTGKLRAEDPDYYDTRYEWNMDSLKSRVIHPNGNITEYIYERDLNPNAHPRMRGNLRIVRHLPGSHEPVGDQEVIEEKYAYDTDFGTGGCCGFNFISKYTDGRGNEIHYEYDAQGNLTRKTERIASIVTDYQYNSFGQMTLRILPDNGSNHRRTDRFTYYESGPQEGYRHEQIIDHGQLALTTSYTYDLVGNKVSITDPRGHDRLFTYNALNQVVRETSREVVDGSGIRYEQDYYYDANNNLIRHDVQNLDEEGVLQANTHFTTRFEYEILDKKIRMIQEVNESREIVKEYGYDANRNRILIRNGEAVNGNQPTNTTAFVYDERDLVYRKIRAPEDPQKSTDQFDYDANKNMIRFMRGLEGEPRKFEYQFDGYDRKIESVDPMGNRVTYAYDANDNPVAIKVFGELLDVGGDGGNVLLKDVVREFDPLNRITKVQYAFFDSETGASIGDGMVATEYAYNDFSQITEEIDDNLHQRLFSYDTANRNNRRVDPNQNEVIYTFDANSNIVSTLEIEKSDLGGPDEEFLTTYGYDNLDRPIGSLDQAQNTHEWAYDSRYNRTLWIDAARPNNATDPGNKTFYEFDGLNRKILTRKILTDDGSGTGMQQSVINLRQEWDDTSRLVGKIDENGNRTSYAFDALNRQSSTIYADGTQHDRQFDSHHNVVAYQDANGNQVAISHDLLDRVIEKNITPGPSVSDETTFESLRYDGLSRLVSAEDNDSRVTFSYDSGSRPIRETLNGQATASLYDGVGNRLQLTYPSGRILNTQYDALDRPTVMADQSGTIATYAFAGPRRVAQRTLGNGTRTIYAYDEVKRIVGTTQVLDPAGAALVFDEREYRWDRMYNKTSRTDVLSQIESTYAYDSMYRMNRSNKSLSGSVVESNRYAIDGVGNRLSVEGGVGQGSYQMDDTSPEPNDLSMNQYTSTPFDTRAYDRNGNLVQVEDQQVASFTYNYRNQQVSHFDELTGKIHLYKYDALGRRIEKIADPGGDETITKYFYKKWQVIEEQDAQNNLLATYVFGRYIDEVLSMRRGNQDYYYHTDDMYNVVKVTDENGAVVESYTYADFGAPSFFGSAGQAMQQSAIANPFLFQGRRYDDESGLYYFRTRYLDPGAGRFTTRDMIGIWGDALNLGNGYTFVGNNPWSAFDPFGLYCTCDPLLDDDDVREAIKEAWEKTLESGKQQGRWKNFLAKFGRERFRQEEHGFNIRNEDGDYTVGPIVRGRDGGTVDPKPGPDDTGTGHTHTEDSEYGAKPSDFKPSYLYPDRGGDMGYAQRYGHEDNILIGYDPDTGDRIIVRHFDPSPTDNGDKFDYDKIANTSCSDADWQKECCKE